MCFVIGNSNGKDSLKANDLCIEEWFGVSNSTQCTFESYVENVSGSLFVLNGFISRQSSLFYSLKQSFSGGKDLNCR